MTVVPIWLQIVKSVLGTVYSRGEMTKCGGLKWRCRCSHEEVIPHPEPNPLSIKSWICAVPQLRATDWSSSDLSLLALFQIPQTYSQDQEAL